MLIKCQSCDPFNGVIHCHDFTIGFPGVRPHPLVHILQKTLGSKVKFQPKRLTKIITRINDEFTSFQLIILGKCCPNSLDLDKFLYHFFTVEGSKLPKLTLI